MSSPHPLRRVCRPFLLVIVLLLCGSGLHSVFGQKPTFDNGDPRPNSAPNPQTNSPKRPAKRQGARAKQPSGTVSQPVDESQQEVKKAIAEGNQARDDNEYGRALTHYQKVTRDLNPKEARAFYGMGNVYSDLYCSDSAIQAYSKAVELKPDYLEARIGLGYAYISKERYDDALGQFQSTLNTAPKNVEAHLGLGIVYARKGNYREAAEQINLVINDKSVGAKERAAAYITLGDVYFKQEKWQEAIAQYQNAISLNLKLAKAYLSLGSAQMLFAYSKFTSVSLQEVTIQDREKLAASAKEATDNIERAVNEYGYSRPDAYLFLGFGLMHQSRYQDAISKINIYLAKVKALKEQLSTIDANMGTKCDYGFNLLAANGYWYTGFVYLNESSLEADSQRRADLLNKAGDNFKEVIKLKEDYAIAYNDLGLIYSRQGKYDEAIEQYQKAIVYSKDESYKATTYESIRTTYVRKGRDAEGRGKYEEAIEQYRKAIAYAKDDTGKAQSYEKIGMAYLKLNRYDEAVGNLREAIKLKPNDPSLHEALASIYVTQGNLEETLNSLKKAEEVRTTPSKNPDRYLYLGSTYAIKFLQKRNEEDFRQAVTWLKKVVEIKLNYADAYKALGLVYWKHFDADEALANYNEAIKYDAKDASSYQSMASVYFDLKQNDDAAIGYLKKALEIKSDSAEAYALLGLVYHHKGDDTEAVKQILKAIEVNPKYLQAYLDLASIYKDQKNYAEAIRYINKAMEIAPDNFRPYRDMEKVYEEQQKNEDAIRYYEEAVKTLKLDVPWARDLFLCRIERLRGRYAEAIRCFQKLISTDIPGQIIYETGVTYIAGKNKKAALEQHQQLVQLKSPLAEELLKRIKEMK